MFDGRFMDGSIPWVSFRCKILVSCFLVDIDFFLAVTTHCFAFTCILVSTSTAQSYRLDEWPQRGS